jgi:hypothetical protein
MTPIAGFVIAIIAGWIVRDPRRAAAAVVVPYLAVVAAQSWIIASGRGVSPPSTVTGWPGLIGYWVVQAVFLALSIGIAADLSTLRRRRMSPDDASAAAGHHLTLALGVLAALTAVFLVAYLLDSAPVAHHAADGTPPVQGFVGMLLCIVTFVALSVMTFRGRRHASTELAAADKATAGVGGGQQPSS